MSRIRHATETFVNHLIDGVKKLISSNTEQINVLSTDRGYLTSKDINNMDDLKFNGKFIFSGEIEGITASWHVDVTSGINTHLQIATTTWDNTGNTRGITLTRIFCDGKWSGWQQIATTTKTDISFPYASNYNDIGTTDASAVTKVNNQVIVTMNTCKKDGESFTSGEIIGTLPVGYRPTRHTRSSGMSTNSVPILIEVFTTGNIRIKHAGATNITQITGEVIFYV